MGAPKNEVCCIQETREHPPCRELVKLGSPRTTFYCWYDRSPTPKHVWNRIPDEMRRKVVRLALKETELPPRELVVIFTDRESHFVSEASVYHVLKVYDLITSPAFIVIKAANTFKDKTTAINLLWQTDVTDLSIRPMSLDQWRKRLIP